LSIGYTKKIHVLIQSLTKKTLFIILFLKTTEDFMWILFAFGAAIFAALTTILAKIGIEGINSNLATAIRTVVILILAWAIVFINGQSHQINHISNKNWIFLIASGLATGLSWLCYFKALQLGEASKVAPIDKFSIVLTIIFATLFLNEVLTWKIVIGCTLITAGTIFMLL